MRILSPLLLCVCVLLFGCATIQTVKNSKGAGQQKLYSESVDLVWPRVKSAVLETGGSIVEVNEADQFLLASYSMSAWSWGEKVAVFCAASNGGTVVEVVSKASLATNVTAPNRAPEIFASLERSLAELPRQGGGDAQTAEIPARQAASTQERLRQLKQLRDEGILTEREFSLKREAIVNAL